MAEDDASKPKPPADGAQVGGEKPKPGEMKPAAGAAKPAATPDSVKASAGPSPAAGESPGARPAAAAPVAAGSAPVAAAAPATKPAAPAKAAAPAEIPPDTSPIHRRFVEKLPGAVAEGSHIHMGDLVLKVRRESVLEACRLLRDDPELRFDYLSSVTAVDFPDRPRRFDLVWTLTSIPKRWRFNLVSELADGEEVASVVELWKTADWQEREVYDMFGIRFTGHPDLRRILLPDWWEGWPLRKDYPVEGRGEHEKVIEESLRPLT